MGAGNPKPSRASRISDSFAIQAASEEWRDILATASGDLQDGYGFPSMDGSYLRQPDVTSPAVAVSTPPLGDSISKITSQEGNVTALLVTSNIASRKRAYQILVKNLTPQNAPNLRLRMERGTGLPVKFNRFAY